MPAPNSALPPLSLKEVTSLKFRNSCETKIGRRTVCEAGVRPGAACAGRKGKHEACRGYTAFSLVV